MTAQEIIAKAKRACFYRDADGKLYRMNYVQEEEGTFNVIDEDSGEEYDIAFLSVTNTDKFYELTEIQ